MAPEKQLSNSDVERLLNDPSADSREAAATKIAQQFSDVNLSDSERKIAEDIFRLMAQDAELRVRKALSINLQASSDIPHDIALMFSRDVEEVAIPILQHTDVLSDEDLISIIQSSGSTKQVAIAGREGITEEISDALVETRNVDVVSTLASNENAKISEQSLGKALEYVGDSEKVQKSLLTRNSLPISVTEKLVANISESFGQELLKNHNLPENISKDLILQSRERATVLLAVGANLSEVKSLVEQLHKNNRLTPSIILRAICSGDMTFFEIAMAKFAGVPLQNAINLINDKGENGLRGLLKHTKFPDQHYIAIKAAIQAMEDLSDADEQGPEQFSRRVMELVLTSYGELGVELSDEDLQYLLKKLNEISFVAEP